MEKVKIKVKTWDEMLKKYGWYNIPSQLKKTNIKLQKFGWCKEIEQLIPKNRIIEVEIRDYPYYGSQYHYQGYWISEDAIAKYL